VSLALVHRGAGIVSGLLGLLALPAVASAAVFSGAGQDPANDQTAGGAAADIVALSAAYDDAGTISGQITLSGTLPASSSGFAFVFFGVTQPNGSCQVAYGVGDTLGTTGSNPAWGPPEDPTMGAGTRSTPAPNAIALAASGAALAGKRFNCAYASTAISGGGDRTDPVALVAPPAPTPTPTATAAPPVATPPGPAPARLELSASVPPAVLTNRWTTIKVTLANAGGVDATGVRVRLTAPAKVRVSPSVKRVARLAAGRSVTLKVRVRPAGAARAGAKLTVAASAGALSARQAVALPIRRPGPALELGIPAIPPLAARASTTVRVTVRNAGTAVARNVRLRLRVSGATVRPAVRRIGLLAAGRKRVVALRIKRRGAATPTLRLTLSGTRARSVTRTVKIAAPAAGGTPAAPAARGLAQHIYLRLVSGSPGVSQDTRVGYLFTDDRWVYRGTPSADVSCTAKTASGDDGEGCLPYSYDAKSGALTIDGQPVTLAPDRLTLKVGDDTFLYKPTFAPGARLDVSLKNMEIYGMWPNQTTFTSYLRLLPDGRFATTGSAIGSLGNGDPNTWTTTISPSNRGTYEIVAGSVIQFRYDDGDTGRRVIVVNGTPDVEGGAMDPQTEGILLDGTSYWSS